jgi:hypothetical protein
MCESDNVDFVANQTVDDLKRKTPQHKTAMTIVANWKPLWVVGDRFNGSRNHFIKSDRSF